MNKSKKPTILIYSDCYTFGGSEYVVVNILKSKKLNEVFNFMFAYRYNKEYYAFVNKLFSKEEQKCFYPLRLLSTDSLFTRINSYKSINKYIRYVMFRVLRSYDSFINRFCIDKLFNKRQIRRFLLAHQGQIDAIHINNGGYPAAKTCLLFAICAKEVRIKSFMQVNNCAVETEAKSQLDCDVENAVSFFLTASDYCRKALSINRKFDINKIITLHNAVDFPLISKDRGDVCAEFGIKEDSIVVTEIALLQERKGQVPLLNAFAQIKQRNAELYNRIMILLIGSGEDEFKIKTYIQENKMDEKVKMLGYRMDYLDILNASDIYAQPSICDEDMPLSILSAMALGKPVVTTNIAGIPEEVEDGINGFTVDPQNNLFIQMLSESLETAILNKEIMGKKSHERYLSKFTREVYESKLEEIYHTIMA